MSVLQGIVTPDFEGYRTSSSKRLGSETRAEGNAVHRRP